MHIFGCKFSLRTDTGDTVPDRKNFDSLLWAIVTVFQVSGSVCLRPATCMAFQRAPLEYPEKRGRRTPNFGLQWADGDMGQHWLWELD